MAQYPYYGGWHGWNEDQRGSMPPAAYLANAATAYEQTSAVRSSQDKADAVPPMLSLAELDPLGSSMPVRAKKGKPKKAAAAVEAAKASMSVAPAGGAGQPATNSPATVAPAEGTALVTPVAEKTTKKKYSGRRTTSHVWDHYYHSDDRPGVVLCAHCDMGLRHDSTCTGTSSLQRHLERRHKIFGPSKVSSAAGKLTAPKKEAQQPRHKPAALAMTPLQSSNRVGDVSRLDSIQYNLVRNVVIRDLRPLSVTLDLGLRAQLVELWNKYVPMDSAKASSVLQELTKRVEDKVQTVLRELAAAGTQVSLSWDVWGIGGGLEGFGGWSACWVTDNWELHSATLAVAATPDLVAGTTHSLAAAKLQAQCEAAGVQPEAVFMAVVGDPDTALVAELARWPSVIHARCGPQVLQRIPHQALFSPQSADPELVLLISTAKAMVAYFHRDIGALRELVSLQDQCKLQRVGPLAYVDNGPWNHTYEMIASLCEAKPAVVRYAASHPNSLPAITEAQWTELAQLLGVLAPWKQAGDTSLRSGRPVMVSVYYAVFTLVVARTAEDTMVDYYIPGTHEIQQVAEQELSGVACRLRAYLRMELQAINDAMDESQWQLLVVASALDPRFKRLNFIHATDRESAWQLVLAAAQHQASLVQPSGTAMETDEVPADDTKRPKSLLEQAVESDNDGEGSGGGAEREVEHYKGIKSISIGEDPLGWWAQKASIFPILSQLARHYLAVPVSLGCGDRLVARGEELLGRNWSAASLEETERVLLCHANYPLVE